VILLSQSEKYDIDKYRYCKNFFRYIVISRIKISRIIISRKLSVDFFEPQREFWMSFFSRCPRAGTGMMHWFSFLVLLAYVIVRACYNVSSAFGPSCASHSPTRHRVSLAPPHGTPTQRLRMMFASVAWFLSAWSALLRVAGSMTWTRLCERQSVLSQRKQVCASKVCDERTTPCSNRHRTSEHVKRYLVFQYFIATVWVFAIFIANLLIYRKISKCNGVVAIFFHDYDIFLCFCDIFFSVSSVCDKYRKINWLLFIAKYRNFR
jgi:hypothetical protein